VDGCVCLRNSPRPRESDPHLSGFPSVNVGLAPLAWQWRLEGEDVNKHLSIGSSEFLVFHCSSVYLLLSLLGTALARQILSPLPFLSPTLPQVPSTPSLPSSSQSSALSP
jgi:hypothetical protein